MRIAHPLFVRHALMVRLQGCAATFAALYWHALFAAAHKPLAFLVVLPACVRLAIPVVLGVPGDD